MADPLTANHKAPEHMALELEHRGRDRREVERQNLALLGTINEMGGKIRRDAESNW